jgi:hypothetical protein
MSGKGLRIGARKRLFLFRLKRIFLLANRSGNWQNRLTETQPRIEKMTSNAPLIVLSIIAVCVALWAGSMVNKAMTEAAQTLQTKIEAGY